MRRIAMKKKELPHRTLMSMLGLPQNLECSTPAAIAQYVLQENLYGGRDCENTFARSSFYLSFVTLQCIVLFVAFMPCLLHVPCRK